MLTYVLHDSSPVSTSPSNVSSSTWVRFTPKSLPPSSYVYFSPSLRFDASLAKADLVRSAPRPETISAEVCSLLVSREYHFIAQFNRLSLIFLLLNSLFGSFFYASLGIGGACSLLAGVSALMIIPLLGLFKYGDKLRARSKWAA